MLLNIILTLLLVNPIGNVYFTNKPVFNVNEKITAPIRINPENIGVKVTAKRWAVIDEASGALLYQRDSNLRQPIASITKLMTAIVILEMKPDWQKLVTMQETDETIGAYPHLYRGEQVRFIDLWKAGLISSDNNAIKAMIRSLDLEADEFVALMNVKARTLNMNNTFFSDAIGLDEKNLSTPIDVALLVQSGMRENEIRESVLEPQYEFKINNTNKKRKIFNTDILVDSFLNRKQYGYELIGGKTGYLEEAGYCLTAIISRENHPLIIVVLNSATMAERFADVKALADWTYGNYQWQ
ncbi:D-alanyl-D-alanine carboxypeptidase [Candidatus Falkowbacteria bacterium]|nr:D-alanyl-D-alanine carboxypeptidase [Candidatus Falkowbacteria bacterium]